MKKVLYCGYRDWSMELFNYIQTIYIDKYIFTLVKSKNELLCVNLTEYDLLLFIGWSWFVPINIVDSHLCLCLHPSPLPLYRGGSPIQHQIINGETISSVSIFKMIDKLDAGMIYCQQKFSLEGNLNCVLKNMTEASKVCLKSILDGFSNDSLKGTSQNEQLATTYKRRTVDMSEITLDEITNSTPKQLYNKIRSLQNPYPNAYVKCKNGEKLFILECRYE